MMLALAVALGCDLFDSAAYALYAKDGRYLTVDGTYHIGRLAYLPCSCPVCIAHTAKEIAGMDEAPRTRLLAEHNLYATFAEIRLVKQSILDGDLMELVERRCRSHPKMLSGLKHMMRYSGYIERFDRATKSSFFYLGPESACRPEVIHYNRLLKNIEVSGNVLISTRRDIDGSGFDRVFHIRAPFGVFPDELSETYPIGQSEVIGEIECDAKEATLQNIIDFILSHPDAGYTFAYDASWESPLIAKISEIARLITLN